MNLILHATTVEEALDRADSRHWNRRPPQSDRARATYLLKQAKGCHHTLATRLKTQPDAVARILAGHTPTDDVLHYTIERELLCVWQPRVRQRAHHTILRSGGLMTVTFRARFGFTAAAGSTDDQRLRMLTLSLRPPYPEQLFHARHRNAPERELHRILTDALVASYFYRSTNALESVTLNEVDFLEFYY